jgi:hypothetical protein
MVLETIGSIITGSTPVFAGGFLLGLFLLKRFGIWGMPGIMGSLALGVMVAAVYNLLF